MALLVGGDDAEPALLEQVLAEAAKYGVLTTRRISGDWTMPELSGGKRALHAHAGDWTAVVEPAEDRTIPDDGWAFLGAVGDALRPLDPAFETASTGTSSSHR